MASASGSHTNRPSTRGAGGDSAAHSGGAAQPLTGASPSSASAMRPSTRGAENNTQLPPLPYGASADLKKVQASLDRIQGNQKSGRVDGESSVWDNYTYNAERVLGSGAFGIVYQARIVETGDLVAIKKVLQDARFKNRELEIMQELKHPNIVELKHAFHVPGDKPRENYLNVVMEYCPETVHNIMKHHTKTRQLVPHLLVQLYTYHMLRGVAYMHAMNICHRDIKPPNLLVNNETHELKICDFGSAKRLSKGEPNVAYICSRYYRAPELIFGATQYSTLIDMWSVACVTAELILQQVLFPGDSGVDQLMEIIKVLGTPTREELESMNPVYGEFKFPQIKSYPWSKIFRSRTSPEAVDWLSKVLQYNPAARPTGLQACMHPLFDDLRKIDTRLPPNQKPVPDSMFWFSDEEMDLMENEYMKQKLIPNWIAFQQGGKWPQDLGVTRRQPVPEGKKMSLPSVDGRHAHEMLPSLEEKRPNTTGHSARNRDNGSAAASGADADFMPDPLANLQHRPDPMASLHQAPKPNEEKKKEPARNKSPRPEDMHAPGHAAPPGTPPGEEHPVVMGSGDARPERERKEEKRHRKKKKERAEGGEESGDPRPATSDVVGEERDRTSPRHKKSKRHRKRDADAAAEEAPVYHEAEVVNFSAVDERGRNRGSADMSAHSDRPSPLPPEEDTLAPLSSRRTGRGSNELSEPPRGIERSSGHGKSKHRSHTDESASGSGASGAQLRNAGTRHSRENIDAASMPPAL